MKHTDRRITKTKRLIKETLATLLLEKELQTITVKELTDMAEISRSTFYAHYSDVFDLYDHMENELLNDLNEIIVTNPTHEYYDLYILLIDYVYDNAVIFRSFMNNSRNSRFRNKLADFFEEKYNEIVLYEMGTTEITEDWKYISRFINGGIVHILALWLENNLSHPKETIFKIIADLDYACDPVYDLY